MTPAEVYDELNKTFLDWDGLLANPRFCRQDGFVSWTRFSDGRLKEPVTTEQVLSIIESGQFSFQCVEDGSFFQILYSFDTNGILQVVRLAFYLLKIRGNFEDGTAELVSNSWIRLDYDLSAAKGVLHHDCHLHLHGFPNARIIVDGVPGPRQFVEFVISICYPEFYRIHRLDQNDNIQDAKLLGEVNLCRQKGMALLPASPVLHIALPK